MICSSSTACASNYHPLSIRASSNAVLRFPARADISVIVWVLKVLPPKFHDSQGATVVA